MKRFKPMLAGLAMVVLMGLAHGRWQGSAFRHFVGNFKGSCFQYAEQVPDGSFKCSKDPVTFPQYITFMPAGKDALNATFEHVNTNITRNGKNYGEIGAVFPNVILTILYRDLYGYCIHLDIGGGFTGTTRMSVTRVGDDWVFTEEALWYTPTGPDRKIIHCPPKNRRGNLKCKPKEYGYRCIGYKVPHA